MKFLVKLSFVIFFILFSNTVHANDSLLVSKLVNRIYELQLKKYGKFPAGMFPSHTKYFRNSDKTADDNSVYFTALMTYTLRSYRNDLPLAEKQICDNMIANASKIFPKYKNAKGRDTYNFWPVDTLTLPGTFSIVPRIILSKKKRSKPLETPINADDMDDTSIILMATDAHDSIVRKVHTLMQGFTNCEQKRINNTYRAYKYIPAYSTFFGVKWPIEFDISVLSNVLCMVSKYNLPFTKADSASLELITNVVKKRQYMKAPEYVSSFYGKSSLILYHISRLMQHQTFPELEKYKSQLVNDTRKLYLKEKNFMEKVILSTSLMRWGVTPEYDIPEMNSLNPDLIENADFPFFYGDLSGQFPNPFKRIINATRILKCYWYCPSYNNLLVLENVLIKKKLNELSPFSPKKK